MSDIDANIGAGVGLKWNYKNVFKVSITLDKLFIILPIFDQILDISTAAPLLSHLAKLIKLPPSLHSLLFTLTT